MELIVSQEKLNQNRKNTLLKDETKRLKAEQNKLNKICIYTMIALVIVVALAWGIHFIGKATEEARNNCLEQGYTMNYCLKHS